MIQPLVSVVIPFFSGVSWLKEALTSVQNQTYKNIEVIVINDGSREQIEDTVNTYNINVTVYNKENGGPSSARNYGIDKSSGKYIAFLDSDDTWLPDKLTTQIKHMEINNYVWSQHSYEMFWENSNKTKKINTAIYSGNLERECYISLKIQTSCVVVLKSVLVEKNIRFPLYKRYGQDGDFYRQLAKYYPIGFVDGTLSRFRIRGTNAGFRANVQIKNKALTWLEIKGDNSIRRVLPAPVILAYSLCNFSSTIIDWLNVTVVKNDTVIENISRVFYVLPYTIFKIYSKKSNEANS